MPAIKYKVELTPSQRSTLVEVSRRQAVRTQRALALLKADEGLSDQEAQWRFYGLSPERGTVRRRGAGSRNQRPATPAGSAS